MRWPPLLALCLNLCLMSGLSAATSPWTVDAMR